MAQLKDTTISGNLGVSGNVNASLFIGSGTSLTNLNASNISSGTLALARIPTGTGATQVALGNHTHNGVYLNTKPDGTNLLISNNKITTGYLPDFVLGQVIYGGNVNASTAVATLSDDAKSKLGTTSSTITLTNNTTALTGYSANKNIYYIATTAGSFANLGLQVGDWLISIGSAWKKVDNTDAVTGIKGNSETIYRTGNVNITAANIGLGNVDNVKQYSASNPPPYPVTSVNGSTGAITGLAVDSAVVHKAGNETVSGVKTFTSESKFTNSGYAPTFTDVANGLGKSSCFTRSATMQGVIGQILAPNANVSDVEKGYNIESGKIKIQSFVAGDGSNGAAVGQPVLTDIANFSSKGLTLNLGDVLDADGNIKYATPSEVPDDSTLVHKSGNETIGGTKTFSSEVKFSAGGGNSDISSSISCAFKTNRGQLRQLITNEIWSGKSADAPEIKLYGTTGNDSSNNPTGTLFGTINNSGITLSKGTFVGNLTGTATNSTQLGGVAASSYLTSHQSVTNKGATLSWGGTSTIATIGSTDIKVTMPANPNTDTKNTAGSTNTDSKIYLIGATSQATNPQTYSDSEVYTTNGTLTANKMQVTTNSTFQYNSTAGCLELVFA